MSPVRPCDRASALILAWQDELTALGLLRDARGDGGGRRLTDRQVQPCGTEAAAQRHRRHGEPLCDLCRKAEAA